MRNFVGILLSFVTLAAPLEADIRITENISGQVLGKKGDGVRTTTIQGRKVRLDTKYKGRLSTLVMDMDREDLIQMDPETRSTEVRKFSEIRKIVKQHVDLELVKSSTRPSGHHDTILGYSCDEHAFSVRIPTRKNGRTIMVLTGSACVAKEGVGVKEYQGLLSAAESKGPVILSFDKDNVGVVRNWGHMEVLRMINGLGGIPLRIAYTIRYEGFGAGIMNKLAVTKNSLVTAISAETSPKESFGIPEGWKAQQK